MAVWGLGCTCRSGHPHGLNLDMQEMHTKEDYVLMLSSRVQGLGLRA